MMRKLAQAVIAIAVCAVAIVANAQTQAPPGNAEWQQRVENFLNDQYNILHDHPPGRPAAGRIKLAYDTLLGGAATPARLSAVSTKSLDSLFRAASEAAFYTFSEEIVRDMVTIASELWQRQALSDTQATEVFKALFSVRMFAEATAWRQQHIGSFSGQMPKIMEPSRMPEAIPSELVVSASGQLLERRPVDFAKGSQVIVAAHPLCHFTQNAIAQIMADPILSNRLKDHVRWLVPQHRNYDIDVVRKWNDDHPKTPMTIAYKASEWASIDAWDTPTFYFFRDGRLMETVVGWPKTGNMAAIYAASSLIGLDATDGAAAASRTGSALKSN